MPFPKIAIGKHLLFPMLNMHFILRRKLNWFFKKMPWLCEKQFEAS
jgi:hypothetical protein